MHTTLLSSNRRSAAIAGVVVIAGFATTASAQVTIDNDIAPGTLGSFAVEVSTAGDSEDATLTSQRASDSSLATTNILFDYLTYVQFADGSVTTLRSSATALPTLTGDDQVTSSGSFFNGAIPVSWTAVTSIPDNSTLLQTVFSFDGNGQSIGGLRLIDYVDQDLFEEVDDDVLFTTGSAATDNLQVFTVDDIDIVGVSQSGAFSAGSGLVNATFAGFAADMFSDLEDDIQDGSSLFLPTGVIDTVDLPPVVRPALPGGVAFGPNDITSALAWDIDPTATTATIVVSLGGVPDSSSIPEPTGLASLAAFAAAGLATRRRR